MMSFNTFLKGWDNFFHSKTDASTLCLFRICLGFCLFLNGISLVEDFQAWFGTDENSLVPLADSLRLYSDFRINLYALLSPTETSAWLILITYIVSSVTFMIGYKSRLSSIVCFILLVSIQNRNYTILNSGDTIMRCMLFLMMFAPIHLMYSVDAWEKKRNGEQVSTEISIVTIRLLQLQFSLVYLATTLFKLKGYDWVDGTAIYYTSRLENFQRIVLPVIFDYSPLVKFMTWTALLIEFAMGSLIWIKEWRKWVLLAGLALHLGIEVSMSIGFFEWVMISAYILFLEPAEYRYLIDKAKSLFSRIPGRALVYRD
jgi:antimicrobial peptide system SdpB family protein